MCFHRQRYIHFKINGAFVNEVYFIFFFSPMLTRVVFMYQMTKGFSFIEPFENRRIVSSSEVKILKPTVGLK